jgi:hypothetical protein
MSRPRGYSAEPHSSSKTRSVGEPKTSVAPIPMDSKARKAAKKKVKRSFEQTASSVGLLVTAELNTAIARCKARVENIAANCRARNQKFRYACSVLLSMAVTQGHSETKNLTWRKKKRRVCGVLKSRMNGRHSISLLVSCVSETYSRPLSSLRMGRQVVISSRVASGIVGSCRG